jgi:phosphatidylinositol glycan class A protein
MSRLEYRKGFDLLVEVIPEICRRNPNVYWIIGGDGTKMPVLRFLVKKCGLESRVEILGMVPQGEVQNVLNRGHVFINTSITEAFCIAVLEAVACGLKVVSTNVGGIPEILPKDMVLLCDPKSKDLLAKLEEAVADYKNFSPSEFNSRVATYYSWRDVAKRTEACYRK